MRSSGYSQSSRPAAIGSRTTATNERSDPLAVALIDAAKRCANTEVAELLREIAANGKGHVVQMMSDTKNGEQK